ncbi:MAG: hypothetical protein KGY70_09850 [Bacteroidales bacterium]|nr:hypothetical protein [Bacteroidales bacterium]
MKTSCAQLLISSLFFLLIQIQVQSQNPTYRLTVSSGGNVEFKVYSFRHYENGIDYLDLTHLEIVYADTTAGPHEDEWYLGVKAQDDAFYSNYPGRTLDLSYVTLEASDGGGDFAFNSGEITSGEISLSSTNYALLVSQGDAGRYRLNVTYHLDSITGSVSGFYNTNLLFKMDTVAPPW